MHAIILALAIVGPFAPTPDSRTTQITVGHDDPGLPGSYRWHPRGKECLNCSAAHTGRAIVCSKCGGPKD